MTNKRTDEEIYRLYRLSDQHVRAHSMREEDARPRYQDYVNFVQKVSPFKGYCLDIGCGNGWSSFFISQNGYLVVGCDLNTKAFEPSLSPSLHFVEGSALNLPFADETFDVVSAYQVIEHVPDPRKMLDEMLRVLKLNRILCIVGPNLLSPALALRTIFATVWRNRPFRTIFLRTPEMPYHPYGNTLFEAIPIGIKICARLCLKLIVPYPFFDMRIPDKNPPFYADNDACYVCNPTDIKKYLQGRGCRILQYGSRGVIRVQRYWQEVHGLLPSNKSLNGRIFGIFRFYYREKA